MNKFSLARPLGGVWGGEAVALAQNVFKMQFARRAQEGVWGGNAHALAFGAGADWEIDFRG